MRMHDQLGAPTLPIIASIERVMSSAKSLYDNIALNGVDVRGTGQENGQRELAERMEEMAAAVAAAYDAQPDVAATGVTVSPVKFTLRVGETVQLDKTVLPTNTADQSVSWSSSGASATVGATTGIVTGASVGTATITAETTDGGFTAECEITVVA